MVEDFVKVADLVGGYELVKSEDYAYTLYVRTPDDDVRRIMPNTTIKLCGKEYNTIELFKTAFPEEDDFYRAYYGMSKKTKQYLDKTKEDIGLVRYYHSIESIHQEVKELLENAKLITLYPANFFDDDIEVYKTQDKYIVNYITEDFETYYINSFVFNKYPTMKDIETAIQIEYIEFALPHTRDNRRCSECDEVKSFVEFAGDSFLEKVDSWKNRVCEKCSSMSNNLLYFLFGENNSTSL